MHQADPVAGTRSRQLPLVLLHADAGRASQWDALIAVLPRDRTIAAFDFRGHGDSAPAADADYSFSGRAADVGAVMNELGFEKAVLVAHSGGSAVALAYAEQAPARVAALMLVDPPADPRAIPPNVREQFVRDAAGDKGLEATQAFYASIAGNNPEVRTRVLADVAVTNAAAIAGVSAALAAWNPEPALDAFAGPSFVLASPGTDAQRALYKLRPRIPHRVVAGVGHWIAIERPDEVATALTGFC
ncbi:alpha/beta fold hydrolase [Rhizobacter sp. P5_C2]